MFEGPDYPKSLDEEVFNQWLEDGRQSLLGYHFLLIIWDQYESAYQRIYTSNREEIASYSNTNNRERLVAVYDLYSESRIF